MGNELGKKLRKLREEHGLSQEKFANDISVSRQIVSRWENGEVIPNVGSVKKICDYYKIDSTLLFNTENPNGDRNVKSRKFLKLAIIGIALCILLVELFYICYNCFLIKDIEGKFKQYESWDNYYAEIRSLEEARLIRKEQIWYKDNKYKIIKEENYEDGTKLITTMWIDCNKATFFEKNNDGNEEIIEVPLYGIETYENGRYLNSSFYWIDYLKKNTSILKYIVPNYLKITDKGNTMDVKMNNTKIEVDKQSFIPITYIYFSNNKIVVKYYDIKLNIVNDEDVVIKKDL